MIIPSMFLAAASLLLPARSDVQTFSRPIDALSVTLPSETATAEVSYFSDGTWSAWETLAVENEQDPLLTESNLLMFPQPVTKVRVRAEEEVTLNPVAVSTEPVRYEVAATTATRTPRILSRDAWGADDSFLYRKEQQEKPAETPEENGGNASQTIPQRVRDCEQAQVDYPHEFKVKRTVTEDDAGRRFRWARQYSPSVELITVHHTAVKVEGDNRSGAERVRALYAYHANNRGWGDIGYHYLIDEDGQIYEGKSGGKYVVAGHAYCNNVGTVGVALLGNFEEEKPTQDQLKALQWLIVELAEDYDIDLDRTVTFHGKRQQPVVGHRDLLSTECPGFYVYGAMAQIRQNVSAGDVYASVKVPVSKTGSATAARNTARVATQRLTSARVSSAPGTNRRVQRILQSDASRLLRRKLGSNPGRELEAGVAARLARRTAGTSSSSRVRTAQRSSARTSVQRSARSSRSSARSLVSVESPTIRIRLTRQENGATSCEAYDLNVLRTKFRGTVACQVIEGRAALINTVTLEDYMAGLAEEPDTEPYEKQRAFAVAARTYAAYYMDPAHLRKFPGMPYDGSDSPATFQLYGGIEFERNNPRWVKAVQDTAGLVLKKDGKVIRAPYFSANDGRTRTPEEAGWKNFPFAEVFSSKPDPWCEGETLRGHGVGMSGCGAEGQAEEGRTGEQILTYYYPGTDITVLR